MKSPIRAVVAAIAAFAVMLGLPAIGLAQTAGVIGIKFGFTGGYASTANINPTDSAGVVAVTNWNNLLPVLAPGANSAQVTAAINTTWNIAQDRAGNALSGVDLLPA